MLKFGQKIVKYRIAILVISVLLLIPSVFGFLATRINYDILYYLPKDIETMKGQDVLMEDFGKGAYGIFLSKDLSTADTIKMAEKVEKVDHVADVICFDKMTEGSIPAEMLPEEVSSIINAKDGKGSAMFIFFDDTSSSDETMKAIEDIRKVADGQCLLSSMAAVVEDTKVLVQEQTPIYTVIAVVLALLVLMVAMDSYIVPIIFLVQIGMTIIYNLGTNFIKGEISFITMALVAILQLGVTMDYSIFLYHSYKEQCGNYEDKKEAMAHAIAATITSVTGSSLTTIAGFLAMCFMTFTLGLDMGIVMAKGVVMGVVGCVTILPSMVLVFDGLITKTRHREIHIPTKKISGFIIKFYPVIAVLILLLWIPAIIGYKKMNVYYKLDSSLPDTLESVQANNELEKKYDMSSISMILVRSGMSSKDTRKMIDEINGLDGVQFALGMDSVIGPNVPEEFIPEELTSSLKSDKWKLLLVSSEYQVATDEVGKQCEDISRIVKKYDNSGMLIGEAPATRDLIKITDRDFKVVSAVSIGAIFVLILMVLKSVTIPVILVLVIELAIYINMGLAYYTGTTLPFIASVCVGTIQLGATVDYAILLTNRYKTERIAGNSRSAAVRIAIDTSVNSIVSSALGFFAATIGVALYSNIDLIGSICMLLARGALLSMVIVILLLPSMLMICDPLVIRTTGGMKNCIKKVRHYGDPVNENN